MGQRWKDVYLFISIYQIVFYLIVFLFFLYFYHDLQKIPTKNVIQCNNSSYNNK